ncbi:MAG: outer membrane lipoprotein chaperone LolA [Gammaproteobacteria bacterium]|nr:outer membrane lipoprotein chaperone LolA [Gammaproteobacteria bacterium]
MKNKIMQTRFRSTIQMVHTQIDIQRALYHIVFSLFLLTGAGLPRIAEASSGLDSLNHFFTEIRTFEARFGQIVLNDSLEEVDDGQGKVWISRPGLFRWDYEAPDAQEIVGDGVNVWIHDVELEQVTVRDQQDALGNTPAILLAGAGNLGDNYIIEDIGTQGRFDWVNLIPREQESSFEEVRIGFEDNRLRLMELIDSLGQKTRISFIDLKENVFIPSTIFDFIAPDGVDVIDAAGG